MISQEVFLEAEAPYSTGLAGGFFTLKITRKELPHLLKRGSSSIFNGVPERIRTSDTRFRRAVLCPLSY